MTQYQCYILFEIRLLTFEQNTNVVLTFSVRFVPTLNVIERFKYHPSIIAIKQKMANETFEFNLLRVEEVSTEIRKLDSKKSSTGISIGLLKDHVDVCVPILIDTLNSCLQRGMFPDELKLAEIISTVKSVDSTAKNESH